MAPCARYRDAWAKQYGYTYTDTVAYADGDAHVQTDIDRNSITQPDLNGHASADADRNTFAHADRDAHVYTDADRNSSTQPDCNALAHPHPSRGRSHTTGQDRPMVAQSISRVSGEGSRGNRRYLVAGC